MYQRSLRLLAQQAVNESCSIADSYTPLPLLVVLPHAVVECGITDQLRVTELISQDVTFFVPLLGSGFCCASAGSVQQQMISFPSHVSISSLVLTHRALFSEVLEKKFLFRLITRKLPTLLLDPASASSDDDKLSGEPRSDILPATASDSTLPSLIEKALDFESPLGIFFLSQTSALHCRQSYLMPLKLFLAPDAAGDMRALLFGSKLVGEQSFFPKLMNLFKMNEDLENLETLHVIFKLVKGIILLNSQQIFEKIFADEFILDTIGCLEYDPEVSQVQHHRSFLKEHVVFKEAIPIKDSLVLSKIHQTYRIGYLKDVILPRALDEATIASLNSIIHANNAVVNNMAGRTLSNTSNEESLDPRHWTCRRLDEARNTSSSRRPARNTGCTGRTGPGKKMHLRRPVLMQSGYTDWMHRLDAHAGCIVEGSWERRSRRQMISDQDVEPAMRTSTTRIDDGNKTHIMRRGGSLLQRAHPMVRRPRLNIG
ncbi:hypothetical protein KSP40_PGU008272 [Platanthera guangdongensis]|uniref:Serine/threonine-protein phosphatase 4 regulatory subunit 3-like central domain-containing protein n=1 Tax=Platanthera guangdongensis TaxID=2320717 RepID=A0ABR2MWT6_9ASPA